MSDATTMPILELVDALPAPAMSRLAPVPLDLHIMAGDCVLIDVRNRSQATEFADLCCGLLPLRSGSVRFLGRDWADTPDEQAAALRGRIGRLHGPESWIGFLGTDFNILLPQLHHTRRPEPLLREAAAELSRDFGLPGLPVARPAAMAAMDLVRAACVRALIGEPRLLLVDNPDLQQVADVVPALLNKLTQTIERDVASIWLTRGDAVWNDRAFPATIRLRLAERGLMSVRTPP
jgi:phospholipid/cholesterol/gamma-HCH transport system ATP-binding protein